MSMTINTVFDFNRALAYGQYAWPGGYEHYFICSDGEALCWAAAIECQGQIRDAIIAKDGSGGWRVVGMDCNWEDDDLYCSHTNSKLEPEYR